MHHQNKRPIQKPDKPLDDETEGELDKKGNNAITRDLNDDVVEQLRRSRMLYLLNGLSEIGSGSSPLVDYAFSMALESSTTAIAQHPYEDEREGVTSNGQIISAGSIEHARQTVDRQNMEIDSDELSSLLSDETQQEKEKCQKQQIKPLIESLHRKWLSDPRFPPVAVRIVARLGHLATTTSVSPFSESTTFLNVVYALILADYKDWHNLRKISRNLLCNSVHFAFEFMRYFYPFDKHLKKEDKNRPLSAYRPDSLLSVATLSKSIQSKSLRESVAQESKNTSFTSLAQTEQSMSGGRKQRLIDEYNVKNHVFEGMVDPMYHYLHILIDDLATEQEISLMYYLVLMMGPKLDKVKPDKMLELSIQIRRRIIESRPSPKSVAMLMELVELHSHNWSKTALQPKVDAIYSAYAATNQFLFSRSRKESQSSDDEEYD